MMRSIYNRLPVPKIYFRILSIVLLIILSGGAGSYGQQNSKELWSEISESSIVRAVERESKPDVFKTFKLDLAGMKAALQQAPLERIAGATSSQAIVEIPLPDGKLSRFRVVETPVMEPGLAAQFPFIRTFSGQGIDDPTAVARFDYTLFGFHSMVMSANGWFFIEPYVLGNTGDYIVYDKKHSRRTDPWVCEVDSTFKITDAQNPVQHSNERTNGAQLRTYRLALACTGEYAATYGGTAAGAMSGMVTSVNRVTGVYELEVAIRMVLIANDNLLVYTNAATDPYTNGSGTTMLTENINNINAVIGSANYDIGHVFSTGGGGVAGLGVVCGASKARGVTGRGSPIGDAFDIDYVAHEMGHQFGGNHTFNSVTGSCNGNRASTAAYEPGSGTTIMAYAGICGADDIQPHSDAIFHTKSFDEIVIYSTTGTGNSCPVTTANGNTIPVITSAGANYTIPFQTPFSLTGAATDANGDALTYLWEEYDLGASGAPNSPSGDAPIFRDFVPVSSPTRTFPRIEDIVSNTQTIGEILPSYARTLNFRLTVRDNRAGGGGVNHPDTTVKVTVVNTTTPFLVTSPNTAVTWLSGSVQNVIWDVSSTNVSPISCANVNILLSTDGGYTYPITLLSNTPNDGAQAITVPVVLTTQARVKVAGAGNIFFDISNVNFTIAGGSAVLSTILTSSLASSSVCAGGAVSIAFGTDGPANAGNIFTAQLSDNTGSFASPVIIGTLTSTTAGSIPAIIPAGTTMGGNYRIRVISSNPAIIGSDNGTNLTVVSTPAAAGSITGSALVCQGQTGVVYSVPVVANATAYLWTLPTGASITAGSNTNSITVTYSASASSGTITVQGTNAGCSGSVSPSFPVTVSSLPAAAGSISGTATVCGGQGGFVFSVPAISGATGYSWTLPTGASISSGSNTNSITVGFTSSASSGNITVAGTNSCGSGVSSSFAVAVIPSMVAPLVSAGGPTTFCSGGSVLLSRTTSTNALYQWRQDGVAISGATGVSYTATATGNYDVIADSSKPYSVSPATSIPDNTCTGGSSTIAVAGYSGTVASAGISVKLNITHTYDGDLVLTLEAPNGNILGLSNQVGGSGQNFTNTVFSDAGSAQISGTAPFTGTYKPYTAVFTSCVTTTTTSFGAIGGGAINPNGNWILHAYDRASVDVGTIVNWTITFPASLNAPCSAVSNVIPVTVNPAPAITSFSPSSGPVGTNVTINGSGFSGATSVTFNGVSAAFSIVNSGQITATVPSGAGTGAIVVTTGCGTATSASAFTTTSGNVTLNLSVFIEGFLLSSGVMNGSVSPTLADTLTVQLANATSPYAIVATRKGLIGTNGNGSFTFTGAYQGNSYYIVLRHRNSLETWSASPLLMSSSIMSYDFTNAASKAYGSNEVLVLPGKYAIRSGDVNQDGLVDSTDFSAVQSKSQLFATGYVPEDLTGDKLVESSDYSFLENNSQLFLSTVKP